MNSKGGCSRWRVLSIVAVCFNDLPPKADNTDMQVRGSGDIDAVLRNVRSTNIATYGSGDIDVRFIDCGSASAITVGSGDIELKGSLGSFKQSIKGSGEIDTRELVVGR